MVKEKVKLEALNPIAGSETCRNQEKMVEPIETAAQGVVFRRYRKTTYDSVFPNRLTRKKLYLMPLCLIKYRTYNDIHLKREFSTSMVK